MSRRGGRWVASVAAITAFGWAAWAAQTSSMPEFKVYDGYWMILGAAGAVALVAPFVWRWPRERSLIVVGLASASGSTAPLVISAARHHVPILARLRGSWMLAGADLVGPALLIGFICLWFALREGRPSGAGWAAASATGKA